MRWLREKSSRGWGWMVGTVLGLSVLAADGPDQVAFNAALRSFSRLMRSSMTAGLIGAFKLCAVSRRRWHPSYQQVTQAFNIQHGLGIMYFVCHALRPLLFFVCGAYTLSAGAGAGTLSCAPHCVRLQLARTRQRAAVP